MIQFDFQSYYNRLAKTKDELEKIKVEAEYFVYYDQLNKDEQATFKNLDRQARLQEFQKIKNELEYLKSMT